MNRLYLLCCLFCLPVLLVAQKPVQFTISGYLQDASSGESLIGASVYDAYSLKGTAANNYGFFSLTLPEGQVAFTASYVGYQPYSDTFLLNKDTIINLSLQSQITLAAVDVQSTRVSRIEESTSMSTVTVPIQQIKQLPAFMGEVDVLKALQLLPGVQSGNEGGSGLFVRGGSPDQNLILLDGVPVYNVSHLFGFFSVFNADALNNVTLIKGGFPARYGGRLSSVLEINMKEGNNQALHGEGSIGIIASRLTLEGPLVKDKASFLISARRTYIDILARPIIAAGFRSPGGSSGVAGYYFYDLNGKVNYRLSAKDRLYLSAYMGDDNFYFRENVRYNQGGNQYEESFGGNLRWGNTTSVLRWNHQFSNKLFSNTTVYFSRYLFNTSVEESSTRTGNGQQETEAFLLRYFSGIHDYSVKYDMDYMPNADHYIKTGISGILHRFRPGAVQFRIEDAVDELDTTIAPSFTGAGEFRAYVEDDIRLGDRLKVNIGLHGSAYVVRNRWFGSLEPRFSGRYLLRDNLSVKASFASMTQYIHLLTNSGVGLPTDLWVPATDKVPPQRSWQVAGGLAQTLGNRFEVSLEAYYKHMANVIEYKDGAGYLGNANDWEGQVESGDGWSYGAEFFIQKKEGKTTGWVGYTLAWTQRQFPTLNFGEVFPYKYDRRHDISIVLSHQISDEWDISGTWVYGTGNAISLPLQRYNGISPDFSGLFPFFPSGELFHYESRNGFRMNPYHRMDLGITRTKQTKWGTSKWNLSVYNFYNRRNPFFIYYSSDNLGNPVFKQVSLFPVLPSINWSFSF